MNAQSDTIHTFSPSEIIFCPTSRCNLRCKHCFVFKEDKNLDVKTAENFLTDAINNSHGSITHVGFSGGEPFLRPDFLCAIISSSVEKNLFFDRITTNGLWWNTEEELDSVLKSIYDAGFDGKIGLSWDSFHGMNLNKTVLFINKIHQISNDRTSVEILSVADASDITNDIKSFMKNAEELSTLLNGKLNGKPNRKNGNGIFRIENDSGLSLPLYRFSQSFMPNSSAGSDGKKIWHEKKWFKDDYCQHTGQTLFVHADGRIAPCCGFANEMPELSIGNINDTFPTIMEKASANKMVNLCFTEGLSTCIKKLKKKGLKTGKTTDMCQFCAFIAQNLNDM